MSRKEKLKLLEIEHKRVGERIKDIKQFDRKKTPYMANPLEDFTPSREWAALKRATLDFNAIAVKIRNGG
jgi:hypothetical protein